MKVEKKIRLAVNLHDSYGLFLREDPEVTVLLERLNASIRASKHAMKKARINDICARCETLEGGSCCGAGIENNYDEWLILINLLLGVKLPDNRYDDRGCYFLGPTGCILKARHVICINYVCERITETVDPALLANLRDKEGLEIEALFLLKERIKEAIKSNE